MKDCDCNDFIDGLFAYLDSEVELSEAKALRAHVERCPECTRIADAETHVRAILRRSCAERAPDQLRLRVHAQLMILRLGGGAAPRAIRAD